MITVYDDGRYYENRIGEFRMKYTESDMAEELRWYYGAKPKNWGFNNYGYSTSKDRGEGFHKLSLFVPSPDHVSKLFPQIWEAVIRVYTWTDRIEMHVIQDDYNPTNIFQDWQKFPDFLSALDAADKLRCQFVKDYFLHKENKQTLDAIEALP